MRSRSHIFTPAGGSALSRRLLRALLVIIALQLAALAWTLARPFRSELPDAVFAVPATFLALQVVALFGVLVLLWRTLLFRRYRPLPGASDAELPRITVVVPAYNEGAQVLATIRSLMASDYPTAKLEVVAIDDGSEDDTWTWIQRGAAEFPDHVVALRGATNRGKREALYEGFGRATGDVIVTVDSDSEVEAAALRNLVTPIVRDPRVGAVAGNVRVLNRDDGPIPAMIDVLFTASFEFIRATQSEVRAVLCGPGALSAYRRDLIDSFKDEWVTQTFLGEPATIGEDRALSNLVLRADYDLRFQANAIVVTKVPTETRQLARMLLRWARSDVRETLVLARTLARRRRLADLGTWVNLCTSVLNIACAPVVLLWLAGLALGGPSLTLWLGVAIVLSAAFPALLHGHLRDGRTAWWAFPYAVYSLVCLAWIQPYALATPHRSKWLTRTLPVARTPLLEPARKRAA